MRSAIRDFFPYICSLMPLQMYVAGHVAFLNEKVRKQYWCLSEFEHHSSCVFRDGLTREWVNENGAKDNSECEILKRIHSSFLFG